MRLIERNGDYIRLVSDLQLAAVRSALNLSSVYRCHSQDGIGVHCGCVQIIAVVNNSRHMHFLEHIQVIVARSTVRTESNVNALVKHFLNRRKAACKLHIACRVVDHADILAAENFHIFFFEPNAVCRKCRRIKAAEIVKPFCRCFAVFGNTFVVLLFRLGKVNMQIALAPVHLINESFCYSFGAGIFCVNTEVDQHSAVKAVVVFIVKLKSLFHSVGLIGRFIGVEGLNGTCDIRLESRLSNRLNRCFRLEIHIREADSTACNHLKQSKAASCTDILGGEPVLDRKHRVKKPLLKRQIAAHSPEKHHRAVVVTVYKSGHQYPAAHILDFVKILLWLFRADIADPVAVNGKISVLKQAEFVPIP